MEESPMFNGKMNVPIKVYKLNYPSKTGHIHLIGEYRRNTWQKPSMLKHIHNTDIYLWEIKLIVDSKLPKFKIEKNSWLKTAFLHQHVLSIKCKDERLYRSLYYSEKLADLLAGNNGKLSGTIISDGHTMYTNFNTMLNHEQLITRALETFETIENII